MSFKITIPILLVQLLLTLFVLMGIYFFEALLDIHEADLLSMIGFLIFQPVLGFVLCTISILVCFCAGLPIRLNPQLRNSRMFTGRFPVIIAGIGLCLILIAFVPQLMETVKVKINEIDTEKKVPNSILTYTGWLVLCFGLMHFFPKKLLFIHFR